MAKPRELPDGDDLVIERDGGGGLVARPKRRATSIDRLSLDTSGLGADLESMSRSVREGQRAMAQLRADEKRAAVERETAMIRELAAVRSMLQRSDAREAAAVERAEAAERRETERQRLADRREWGMAAMTLVAMIAAIVAIFAG